MLKQTDEHLRAILVGCAADVERWSIINLKMKAIFHILNMFNYDTSNRVLVAEGWCQTKELHLVRQALIRGQVLMTNKTYYIMYFVYSSLIKLN